MYAWPCYDNMWCIAWNVSIFLRLAVQEMVLRIFFYSKSVKNTSFVQKIVLRIKNFFTRNGVKNNIFVQEMVLRIENHDKPHNSIYSIMLVGD